MNSTSLQTEISNLFEQRKFQSILERAQSDEISPANNPHASNIVAAALFQIGRYPDCLLWCEALSPSMSGDSNFISMHGAALRRVGRLNEAEKLFRTSIKTHADNLFLQNNFANLLIDLQEFDEAESILKSILKVNPTYDDAQSNLNRLEFQRTLKESKSSDERSATPDETPSEIHLIDPLAAAFSDEEVAIAGGIAAQKSSKKKSIDRKHVLNSDTLPNRDLEVELQELVELDDAYHGVLLPLQLQQLLLRLPYHLDVVQAK